MPRIDVARSNRRADFVARINSLRFDWQPRLINAKAAHAMDINVSPTLLVRADEVIE
jgi:hypothetical protein